MFIANGMQHIKATMTIVLRAIVVKEIFEILYIFKVMSPFSVDYHNHHTFVPQEII